MKNIVRVASDCKRCCGSFPVLIKPDGRKSEVAVCCPVCGKQTKPYKQYWIACQEWDAGYYAFKPKVSDAEQISFAV